MPATRRREQGAVQILVAVMLLGVLAVAALAIDTGHALTTQAQLQNAADAGAHAGIGSLRLGERPSEARAAARQVANQNFVAYGGDSVAALADVELGHWNYATRSFTPSTGGFSAVRVTTRHQLNFFMAPLVGMDSANLSASSVAALGQRDVVLTQDVTASFEEAMPEARAALRTFTLAMEDQSVAGDRLGLVAFNEASNIEQDLVDMPDEAPLVLGAIDDMDNCLLSAGESEFFPCRGTDIAAGIEEAMDQFESHDSPIFAEKVIVLVSDGVPCQQEDTPASLGLREAARQASRDAGAAGISIYSVFLDQPTHVPSYGPVHCWPPHPETEDTSLMRELVTNSGQYYETPDEEDLEEILLSILQSMPVRMVR